MKTKILVGIALSLTIILAAAIVSNYLIQPQPDSPKNQDMQITGVDFCSNGADIIVCFENKGLLAFTFKPSDIVIVSSPHFPAGGGWRSIAYDKVIRVTPQEKLNVTYNHYWIPDAKYDIHADGVYEGTEYRIRISYEIRSPLTYPYYLEITGSLFSPGNKTYDELGAVKRVGDSELTLLVFNHHDTITFNITDVFTRYEGIISGMMLPSVVSIAPKQTVTISVPLDLRYEPSKICVAAYYEIETNSTRYPFFTGQMWGYTYSNYYTHEPTN